MKQRECGILHIPQGGNIPGLAICMVNYTFEQESLAGDRSDLQKKTPYSSQN